MDCMLYPCGMKQALDKAKDGDMIFVPKKCENCQVYNPNRKDSKMSKKARISVQCHECGEWRDWRSRLDDFEATDWEIVK